MKESDLFEPITKGRSNC